MILNKSVHIILLFIMAFQLLQANQYGWFFLLNNHEEECTEWKDFSKSKYRITEEDQSKEFYIEATFLKPPFFAAGNYDWHLSEPVPSKHFSKIPTPPPNNFCLI